jgi:hypothetical protein
VRTALRLLSQLNPVTGSLAAFRWARKTLGMLREARTLEQRALVARDLVAQELRHNAKVLDSARGEDPTSPFAYPIPAKYRWPVEHARHWDTVKDGIRRERWDAHATDLGMLRKRHPAIWREVADAYSNLALDATRDDPVVSSKTLAALADRLDEAEL